MKFITLQIDINLPTGRISPVQRAWVLCEVERRVRQIDFSPAFGGGRLLRGWLRRPRWARPRYHRKRGSRGR